MRQFVFVAAIALSAMAGGSAFAQGETDVESLRSVIAELTEKLDRMETRGGSGKITEIGGGRRGVPQQPSTVVRIYDLSDLFAVAPPYPAIKQSDLQGESDLIFPAVGAASLEGVGGFGGGIGGGGFFDVRNARTKTPRRVDPKNATLKQLELSEGDLAAGRTSIDDLINAIQTTIEPTEWDVVGGPASIARLGNSLLISASPQSHDQIEALLTLFRQKWGTLRTVSVEAWWVWAKPLDLPLLLIAPDQNDLKAFGLVNDAAWEKAIAADGALGYHAVTTCYNGQTVSTLGGSQSLKLVRLTPTIGPQGQVATNQETAVVHEGAALQVTPLTSSSGDFVTLDLHSRVAVLAPALALEEEKAPAEESVDRPDIRLQRLSTTLRAPVGQRMLVGGSDLRDPDHPGESLFLFVRANVQQLRDDELSEAVKPKPPGDDAAGDQPNAPAAVGESQ